MQHLRGVRWALGALVALAGFATFAVTGWAADPEFDQLTASLAPAPVTGGGDVLYTVTYSYAGQAALTHSELKITFPADWTYSGAADPAGCTATSATTLTCPRGTIRSDDPPVVQAVRFTTPVVVADTARQVTSTLSFKEAGSDQNKSHVDAVDAPAAQATVMPVSDNRISKCASKNGDTVATKGGISATNALTTAIVVPSTSGLCSPVSVQEFPAGAPASACPDCTTEVSVTSTPLYTTGNPIKLIFEVYGKPKSWFKDGVLVPPCTGAAGTASPDPCISNRANIGKGLRLTVLSSGNDPSWEGA